MASSWFPQTAPAAVSNPDSGYKALFLADGTGGTTAGQFYTKDSAGTVTAVFFSYTDEQAQDAVGTILTDTATIDFTYDDAGNTISAIVIAGSIGTTQLTNTGPGATGPLGSASVAPIVTIDAKGRVTALSSASITSAAIGAPSGSGTHTGTSSGTNTGDQSYTASADATAPASASNLALTLATVNGNIGSFGDSSHVGAFTVNAKGLTTAASSVLITPAAISAVPTTRNVNTTAPITGGGALSADLTLAMAAATPSVNGYMTSAFATKLTNTWVDVESNAFASPVLPGNSAATNRTNLLALFAAAPSGSTLFFPGATYDFDQNMNIGAKYFSFQGGFGGAQLAGGFTILRISGGTAGLFTLTSGNWYTTFSNIIFAAATTQLSSSMVTVNDNVAVGFTACAFVANGGTQFNCIDYTGTTASANTTVIDRCFLSGFTNVGINVASNGASLVVNNTIIQGQWGSTVQMALAGIQVGEAGALQVDNCDIIGCINNMLLNPIAGKVVASVYVTNTYMDFAGGSCLKISGAGATVRCRFISVSFTCANSFTAQSSVEISTTVTAGAQGIDFENCSMLNTFGQTGTTNGMLITGAADFSVVACRIAGWTNGIQVTPFNSAGKTQPVIANNTIGATGGIAGNSVGILLNAGAVTYGAQTILGNTLTGNTTAITDNSTVTTTANNNRIIQKNTGFNPKTAVAPAVPATTVAAFNSNGCDCTVWVKGGTLTAILIGGVNVGITAANAVAVPYPVAANQSIAITFTVAPTWVWVGS